jgi:uncharacterized membrane protein
MDSYRPWRHDVEVSKLITNLEELEAAVVRLSPEQLRRFRRWFEEYDAQTWDRQIEEDVQAGRLDALAAEARAQYESGECRPL